MNKEIKIINYVFKYKEKLSLISVEHYVNYLTEQSKIKFLIDDKYFEKVVKRIDILNNKLIFDDLVITENSLDYNIDDYKININTNNIELLNEYQKINKGKNSYFLSNNETYYGTINSEVIFDKIFVDYENLTSILDNYYKIYSIDFNEFSGNFNMVVYDKKTPHILLKYKDTDYRNKKQLAVRRSFFKFCTYKFKVSGNFYCKLKIKINKTFKSNPAVIPFKYQKGMFSLIMKKNLFKKNLIATGKEILVIGYKYI